MRAVKSDWSLAASSAEKGDGLDDPGKSLDYTNGLRGFVAGELLFDRVALIFFHLLMNFADSCTFSHPMI
jgi:hypothetical protein